ncbi:MAG TPA: small ribosomal subunit Rsm22 family protein [Opitutaceae bacterium]|nr:small ribosomal subunit Rsm22 family protein [Opitutaceae bacterium]
MDDKPSVPPTPPDWTHLDWKALDRLRQRFLGGPVAVGAYWETAGDLASYDLTYGERIGWKWDQVLREVKLRGWRPRARDVFDWGCGSGIAARRVIEFFGAEHFDALTVWDHSAVAADFAAEAAQSRFPRLRVAQATAGLLAASERIGLLVISHVLNELSPEALAGLRALIARAEAVLWVEPGTHDVSRRLGRIRDELRATFRIIAPCTHELGCPMFTPGRERDWCHFFGTPPAEIFADSNWVKFGQRAGIDLRGLPYCFVALDRLQPPTTPPDASHIIGRPEHFKPYARWLNCDATGLNELELPKRADPALFKQLDRTKAPLVYRWRRAGDKVEGGEAIVDGGAPSNPPGAPSSPI